MGTNRLGPLPRTKPWRRLVGAFVAGAGAAQVAQEALEAASRRLALAAGDAVLVEAVRLLMLLPIAASSEDFAGALRGVGVDAPDGPDFCDVLAAVSKRLDGVTPGARGRTDVGEMAQAALAEALSETVGGTLPNLFDTDPETSAGRSRATGPPTGSGRWPGPSSASSPPSASTTSSAASCQAKWGQAGGSRPWPTTPNSRGT